MPTTPHNDVEGSPGAPVPAVTRARLGNVRDEFRALTSTCGVYDSTSRAKIKLTGSDRVRWLNGMVTNNIRDLAVGHGIYAFLLNPQGHILGDLYAYNLGDQILVDTEQRQLDKILATFDHYIIMDDVEVTTLGGQCATIGLAGPNDQQVLASAGFDIPGLQPLQVLDSTWRGTQARVVRGESERYPSFEIWIAPEHGQELRSALTQAGALPIGTDALELYRIALGIPRYGQDIRERDLPQETEQQRALNFNKGCYIGQEIVERIRSRGNVHRKFTGFQVTGPPPVPGSKIQFQAKDIGEITSSAEIPASAGDRTIALGYIRREIGTPGKEVQLAESTAVVTDLPFATLLS
jgi:folate-binding protein YgfZ